MKSKTERTNRILASLILFFALLLSSSLIVGINAYPANAQSNGGDEEVSFRDRCNFIKNENKRKECKQKVVNCNPPPETKAFATQCKKDVMQEFQSEIRAGQTDAQGGGQGQGAQGGGGQGGQGGGGQGAQGGDGKIVLGTQGSHQCGNLPNEGDNWKTKLNFGCLGKQAPSGLGPIQDLMFALIRFLSIGVGVILTLSIVAAGIQYTTSEGNAEATQNAKKRIQNSIIGLGVFIFTYTALQFLIPGGIFTGNWIVDASFIIRGILP